MSQGIQFSSNYSGGAQACKVATLPRTGQATITVPVGSGLTVTPFFTPLAPLEKAYFSGQVYKNSTCFGLRVTASYIVDTDCTACTSGTSSVVTQTFDVPAGADAFPIPEGFYQALEFVLLDSTGTPVNTLTSPVEVGWYSTYSPSCPSCYVLSV